MSIKIKVFGQLVEIIGDHELQMQIVSDTDSLKKELFSKFPGLSDVSFVVSVDKKISLTNQKIVDGSVIALLPPFAGG